MAKSADAFRTIREVSEWLDTPAHVLRFWESKFRQVAPVKRAGGRRYYRPNDMLLLGGLKKLLHEDNMSIKEAIRFLKTDGVKAVQALSRPLDSDAVPEAPAAPIIASQAKPDLPAPPVPEDVQPSEPALLKTPAGEQSIAAAPESISVSKPEPQPTSPQTMELAPDLMPRVERPASETVTVLTDPRPMPMPVSEKNVTSDFPAEPDLLSLMETPHPSGQDETEATALSEPAMDEADMQSSPVVQSEDTDTLAPAAPKTDVLASAPPKPAAFPPVASDPENNAILVPQTPVLADILETSFSDLVAAAPALEVAVTRLETLRGRMLGR